MNEVQSTSRSEAADCTRSLCVAVHEDPSFARSVIETLLLSAEQGNFNAIAPSFNVDLVLLAKHAKISDDRRIKKHLFMTSLWLFFSLIMLFFEASKLYRQENFIINVGWLIYILSVFILVVENYKRKSYIIKNFIESDNYKRIKMRIGSAHETRLKQINTGNVRYYGSNRPFVGHGISVHGWSFAIKTTLDGAEGERSVFSSTELYNTVTEAINDLKIPSTVIQNILCVNGATLKEYPNLVDKLLPNEYEAPIPFLPLSYEEMEALSNIDCRAYKCIQTSAWRGDVELSIFFRITLGAYLFVEANYFLLTPLAEKFRGIEKIKRKFLLKYWLESISSASLWGPMLIILSPIYLFYRGILPFLDGQNGYNTRTDIELSSKHNYGAISSIRENCSSNKYTNYFQSTDKEMYMKIIEKAILDSIQHFLKSKGIDTSEFESRKTVIFNNGMLVSGGEVKADAINMGRIVRSYVDKINEGLSGQ